MRRLLLTTLLLSCALLPATAQEVSEKKEIAIFRLSYYDWDIPQGALGSIDEEIKSVFINLGRFDITGMSYRLDDQDIEAFVEKIKEFKQQNVEIPEKFQMGYEVFTEADMNELIGSFIVVVPVVSFFDVEREEKRGLLGSEVTGYKAQVKTSFTFINVEEAKPLAQFFVETSGSDEDSRDAAIQDAIDDIPVRLEYEITKVPEFTLRTGILEINGGEIVIELGQNMGIRKGYEFAIIESRIMSSGSTFDSEAGLLIIKEVGQEVSIGRVIFGRADVGDQLQEVPRLGFEGTPYFNALVNPFDEDVRFFSVLGFMVAPTKGFYDLRPIGGIEFPLPLFTPEGSLLPALWVFGFPFNVYVGGEYVLYLRRLQLRPRVGFGFGALVPWLIDTDEPVVTHLGGFIGAEATFYIRRDVAVSADVGYKLWYGIYDGLLDLIDADIGRTTYGGLQIGVGVSRKF